MIPAAQPPYASADLHRALAAWAAVIGDQYVRSDPQTIANYARTTLPRGTTPAAVVRPDSASQVQQVVQSVRWASAPGPCCQRAWLETTQVDGHNQIADVRPFVDPDRASYVWVLLSQGE